MTYNNIKFLFKDGHRIILLLVLCLFGLCLVASSVVPRTKGKRAADDERVYLVHADELKYDAYGLDGLLDGRGRHRDPARMNPLERAEYENKILQDKITRLETEVLALKKLRDLERRWD